MGLNRAAQCDQDDRTGDVLDHLVQQRHAGLQTGVGPPERRDGPSTRQRGGEPRLPVVLDVAAEARDHDDGSVAHRVTAGALTLARLRT